MGNKDESIMLLEAMTWKHTEEFLDTNPIALVPLGSVEQHGSLGPLGTDFIIPQEFAARLEKENPADLLVLPVMPFGVATHHTSFPGTIDIGHDGLLVVMNQVASSLMYHGVKKFIFLNGHGGNTAVLDRVALEIYSQGGLAAIVDWWTLAGQLNPAWIGGHGAGQEASMMMALRPGWVDPAHAAAHDIAELTPNFQQINLSTVRFGAGTVRIVRDVRDVTSTGGFGADDPAHANVEWGNAMFEAVVMYLNAFIQEFKTVTCVNE